MGLNLGRAFRIFRNWWLVFILIPLATGLIAIGIAQTLPLRFASTATVMVTVPSTSAADGFNANLLAESLSTTYQTFVTIDPVLENAAAAVPPQLSVDDLRNATTVAPSTGSVFTITVSSGDPVRAAALTNALVQELTAFVTNLPSTNGAAHPGHILTVEAAAVPREPFAPRIPAYAALGVIVGLLIANTIVFFGERLIETRVQAGSGTRRITDLQQPLIGYLPGLPHRRTGPAMMFLDDPGADAASETIRLLRYAVLTADGGAPTSLVISSPHSGDGKTLVAANLASALARVGKRVVLIDANMRSPRLHTIFNLDNGVGVGTLLAYPEAAWAPLASQVAPNFKVISAGQPGAYPSDLLANSALSTLIQRISTVEDMVIVDVPALDVADDAMVAASQTDAVVLISRVGKTHLSDLERACESFTESGIRLLGVVTNQGARAWPSFDRIRWPWKRNPPASRFGGTGIAHSILPGSGRAEVGNGDTRVN